MSRNLDDLRIEVMDDEMAHVLQSKTQIDPDYIDEWSARLGLSEIWAKVRRATDL